MRFAKGSISRVARKVAEVASAGSSSKRDAKKEMGLRTRRRVSPVRTKRTPTNHPVNRK